METMNALFTVNDYAQLPEGFPAQLIEGILVKEPAPRYGHQRFASRIQVLLLSLVGPDHAPLSPVDVVLDEHNVYQPDLVVLRELPPDDRSDVGIPLIAIELLSPSTQERDRETKLSRLLEAGTAEVWLVDPREKSIEVRTTDHARTVRGDEELRSEALPGFALTPARLFTPPD